MSKFSPYPKAAPRPKKSKKPLKRSWIKKKYPKPVIQEKKEDDKTTQEDIF